MSPGIPFAWQKGEEGGLVEARGQGLKVGYQGQYLHARTPDPYLEDEHTLLQHSGKKEGGQRTRILVSATSRWALNRKTGPGR